MKKKIRVSVCVVTKHIMNASLVFILNPTATHVIGISPKTNLFVVPITHALLEYIVFLIIIEMKYYQVNGLINIAHLMAIGLVTNGIIS